NPTSHLLFLSLKLLLHRRETKSRRPPGVEHLVSGAVPPPQGFSAGVGGGVWRGGARVAVAAVGESREPLDEECRTSNTCERRQPLVAPVSAAPRRAPPNSAVSPSRDSEGIVESTEEQG
ncbi:Os04g0362375, partial [Oryza sativa Japonica Group]